MSSPEKRLKRSAKLIILLRAYLTATKIVFSKYRWHVFPSILIYELLKRYIRLFQGKFKMVALPNKLYELLIRNELIKSEHVIFTSEDIFYKLVQSRELNFINMILNCKNVNGGCEAESRFDIVKDMLVNKSYITMQILPALNCQKFCIFVKENFLSNMTNEYKINQNSLVQLENYSENLFIPEIATKAYINVFKSAYEIPTDVIDAIINNYFNTPRMLHRNYIYRIEIDDKILSMPTYTQHYNIFAHFKSIYFRCLHLETQRNQTEVQAVVTKHFTNLIHKNGKNQFLPRQILDNMAILQNYPLGLKKYYTILKSSINAFLPKKSSCLSSKQIFPLFMIQGDRGCGKTKLVNAVAADLGMHIYRVDCAEIASQVSSHTEQKLKVIFRKAITCEPILLCFHNFEIFYANNEGIEDRRLLTSFYIRVQELYKRDRIYPVIIVALTGENYLKPVINRLFLEVIRIYPPNKEERIAILQWYHIKEEFNAEIFNNDRVENIPLFDIKSRDIFFNENATKQMIEDISDRTQGFLLGDLEILYHNSICQMKSYYKQHISRHDYFKKIITEMQTIFSDILGAPKIPKVFWSDIGGLIKIKDEIQNSIGLPLKHTHLMEKNLSRSGILLYGPPGTGKTLVAKAVATECNLNFLAVQGPELLNMYVGQSEQNVREIFTKVRTASPCVLFLDELDSLAPNRGVAGDSGGVMDRVVSQLLAEMDGIIEPSKPIFILAATNRPDLIDPALLRPGRFDKMFFVGPCTSTDDKIAVLKTQIKLFNLENSLNINTIAVIFGEDMTGADLYSICTNAWLSAVRRTINKCLKKDTHEKDLKADAIIVNKHDFEIAFQKFIPSITKQDMNDFSKLKLNN